MPDSKDALEVGRFAADEADDNAIDVSNPEYIGVDAEYRNHAEYPDVQVDGEPVASAAPVASEDDATRALQEKAKEHGQVVDGPHGYTTQTAAAGGITPASPYSAGAQQDAAADDTGGEQEQVGDATADPDASNDSGGSLGGYSPPPSFS